MGFAEDKVYEYIREYMSDFHHIRVLQLIRHLPCLSDISSLHNSNLLSRGTNSFTQN
uniref:Uncharacterized protein n=1 Tax=Terrapene triunguis TaxID=2587831 RepID=A0A674J4A0_9SAUR